MKECLKDEPETTGSSPVGQRNFICGQDLDNWQARVLQLTRASDSAASTLFAFLDFAIRSR